MIRLLTSFEGREKGAIISPSDPTYSIWLIWARQKSTTGNFQLICEELAEVSSEAPELTLSDLMEIIDNDRAKMIDFCISHDIEPSGKHLWNDRYEDILFKLKGKK